MGRIYFFLFLISASLGNISSTGPASITALSIGSSGTGRKLLNGAQLDDDDTVRVDPLDSFKKYRGGFDIKNRHYWSSTIFTGVYGYSIGSLWLLGGVVYFLLKKLCCCCCCRGRGEKRKLSKPSPSYMLPSILTATVLILFSVTATGIILGGSAEFHSRSKAVMNVLINTAEDASQTIFNMTTSMNQITTSDSTAADPSSTFLTSTSHQLNSQAFEIQTQATKNRRSITKGLKIIYLVTTVTVSLNLIALVALSVSGSLRSSRYVKWLIAVCWVFITLCWILSGAYFFIERFSGDACAAFNDFQEDPYNNTLSSILPCDELLSANAVLTDVSAGVHNLVNEINANVAGVLRVCNPFSGAPEYRYLSGRNCTEDAVRIGDIPRAVRPFVCGGDGVGPACAGGATAAVSWRDYGRIQVYSRSLQSLLDGYPGMESLLQCETVKEGFSEILTDHCRPMKRYARIVWIPMAVLSSCAAALTLLSAVKYHYDRTRHFVKGSVKPHHTEDDDLEKT